MEQNWEPLKQTHVDMYNFYVKKLFSTNSLSNVVKVDIKSRFSNYQGMVNCVSRSQVVPQRQA